MSDLQVRHTSPEAFSALLRSKGGLARHREKGLYVEYYREDGQRVRVYRDE